MQPALIRLTVMRRLRLAPLGHVSHPPPDVLGHLFVAVRPVSVGIAAAGHGAQSLGVALHLGLGNFGFDAYV